MATSHLRPAGSEAERESREWLERLRPGHPSRDRAIEELRALLLKAARFEIGRRARSLAHLRGGDLDDLAQQSANDALVAVLAKLDDFRGRSRFTTWAYKFALLEAAVKVRRRTWQARETPVEEERWASLAERSTPGGDLEIAELLDAIKAAVEEELTARQREVLIALAIDGVPIDVLAERLGATRGALYKTLHDARRKLRRLLADSGHSLEGI